MRAFCSSHQASESDSSVLALVRGAGPGAKWTFSLTNARLVRDEECPAGAAKDQRESISGSGDSEYKDGLMSAHFQWVAPPSEKAGLLLSALLIGLVSLGSRGLDTASVSGVAGSSQRSPTLYDLYQRLPLTFERNAGQTDRRVKFLARGRGYTLFLTGDEAVLALR